MCNGCLPHPWLLSQGKEFAPCSTFCHYYSTPPPRKCSVKRNRRAPLTLEELEARITPDVNPYLVTTDADDPNIKIQGQTTLRDAITAADASNNQTISFAANVTGNLQLQEALPVIEKNMEVLGTQAAGIDVLGSGDVPNPFRVFYIQSGCTVTIAYLGISNGFLSSDSGGGIANQGDLTLVDDSITGNEIDGNNVAGGGIYNGSGGKLYLTHTSVTSNVNNAGEGDLGGGIYNMGQLELNESCTIGSNESGDGGGLFNGKNAAAQIFPTATIEYNYGSFGGGIFNSGTLTMSSGDIYNNNAGYGGGIYVTGGILTLTAGVSVTFNQAPGGYGGGMFVNAGTVKVSGGSIAGNTAINGGGICTVGGSLTLTGSLTIAGNTATDQGGGIYLGNGSSTTFNGVTLKGNGAAAGTGYYWQNDASVDFMKIDNQDGWVKGS